MYICICKAITDKQLEEARAKTKNLNEICKNLGLGSECGACLQDALQHINKTANTQNSNSN